MTREKFNELYTGCALIINGQAPANATLFTDDEMEETKALGAWIQVWVYGWHWHWWKWEYGSWWSFGGNPKGDTYVFIGHRPSWHRRYGWFRIKMWYKKYIWCTGTLPRNYVGHFTPRPLYDDLHYWGQR